MSESKNNNGIVIFKEQRVLMLQALWNQFLKKLRDWFSGGNHNWSLLFEIHNESMEFFISYDQAPMLLLKYIKKHENANYSPLKVKNLSDLEAIKRICESIQQNEPSDLFLDKYNRACCHIYGTF